ncbi:MAG: hypothetical protein QXX09_01370 [Candidatus Methanomethylicia archaeon]
MKDYLIFDFLKTFPLKAPVCLPFSTAISPFTITYSMPVGGILGSRYVPRSLMVFKSNIVISAHAPTFNIPLY